MDLFILRGCVAATLIRLNVPREAFYSLVSSSLVNVTKNEVTPKGEEGEEEREGEFKT